MRCEYCFYRDVASHREQAFQGMLSLEATGEMIKKAMDFAEASCSFMFQGGEPTLAGIDYFKAVLSLQKKYSKPGVRVFNSIQTNGQCINDEWARFLARNHFLVGLSIDGPRELHESFRRSADGSSCFDSVINAARLFDKHGVEYNVLSVLTGKAAKAVDEIYAFFKASGFGYLQFIPCLEPLGAERGGSDYALTPEDYKSFLIRIFDLWFNDFKNGHYVSIRHIDNWVGMMLGRQPEACSMNGRCSIQFVVEGDGRVYPCDFYVTDEYAMGNVFEDSFESMARSSASVDFLRASLPVPEECKKCFCYPLCRNGCRRDRLTDDNGSFGKTYYCEAYKGFFAERAADLREAAEMIVSEMK